MARNMIQINEEKCVGCGLCANACQQGAIQIIDGKAKLVHDDYCDGLGNCLPMCPVDAISFSEKEIKNKNHAQNPHNPKAENNQINSTMGTSSGCAGSQAKSFARNELTPLSAKPMQNLQANPQIHQTSTQQAGFPQSQLRQWPIQIKLVPPTAPYLNNAALLIAADCSAYAYANFHNDFIRNKITLIGCPKLDQVDYTEKLTEIIKNNKIKSITLVRMEVPCCGGIEVALKNALKNAYEENQNMIPWQVITISTDGRILD